MLQASRKIVLLVFLIFSAPSLTQGQDAIDWPAWMGVGMDGVWQETGIIESFPTGGPPVLWRQAVGGGYGGPAVAEGRVYLMDRTEDTRGGAVENAIREAGEISGGERVLCLEAQTGKLIWEYPYDCPYKVAYPTGPRCTPLVDGQRVYTLGAMGDLLCLNKNTGEVIWQRKLTRAFQTKPPLWGYASHPLIDGDRLLVPVGGEGTAVVAFDKNTGQEIWRSQSTLDIGYAPLIMFEKATPTPQLIFWHAEGVTSLNPATGKKYWFVKFPEEPNPSQTTIATPRIIGDRLLISEFYKGSLMLKLTSDPPAATELWRSYRTDPKHEKSLNSMMTTPVIKDQHAYGIAYAGRGIGVLRCIRLSDGTAVWSKDRWMEEEPVVFATSFIVANQGRYVMFNDNGELMFAKFSPSGWEVIDKTKILEPTSAARGRDVVWSHPAFSGKKIFVRNDKEIVCVNLAATE